MIEVENPNHVKNKLKKADDITADGEAGAAPELSRRERSVVWSFSFLISIVFRKII